MCALFIKCKNNNQYICNICTEDIDKDKIIGLKCNPKKHIFCYDCIFDWFKILKNKKNNFGNYSISNMCPICRKSGGLLPICDGYDIIKNIHNIEANKLKKASDNNSKNLINPNKLEHECGFKLLTGNGYCKLLGKYEGLCGKHISKKDLIPKTTINTALNTSLNTSINTPLNTQITTPINITIDVNPDKLEHECGMKLKSKDGYCKLKCKEEYGGFCHIHRKMNVILNNDNNILVL